MEKPNLEGKIELDDLLLRVKGENTKFINQLGDEEASERIETVDAYRNQMKGDRLNTDRKKLQFIDEIKTSLGKEIKENKSRGVRIKKRTFKQKFKIFLASIYSKF